MQEPTSPTTFREAVNMLCQQSRRSSKEIFKDFTIPESTPFTTFLTKDTTLIYHFLEMIGTRLVVTQESTTHRIILLLDSRHLPDDLFSTRVALICWHFNQHGALTKKGFSVSELPKLDAKHYRRKHKDAQPLHQLLQAQQPFEDPQSRKDLKDFLDSFDKPDICINMFYTPDMSCPLLNARTPHEKLTILSAFTRPDYSFGYSIIKPKRVYSKKEKPEKIQVVPEPPSPFDINRRTSVSIQLGGLTQAVHLGADVTVDMYRRMNQTTSAIAIHFDEDMHERVVTYYDKDVTKHFVIDCLPPPPIPPEELINSDILLMIDDIDPSGLPWINTWLEIFEFIKTRGQVLAEERRTIVKPILDYLEPFSKAQQTSPWSKCLRNLKSSISKHRILVYSPSDVVLHKIKLPFVHFMKTWKKKKFRSVRVKNSVTNNIVALLGGGMEIVNVACYLFKDMGATADDLNETANFHGKLFELARDWIGPMEDMEPPRIKHNIKNFKHQPKVGNMTMKKYIETRGVLIAKSAVGIWEAVASFLQTEFGFDITTMALTSLSSISFKCIWLKYAQLAGPLSHPMEKMTPYNEARIREWSRGGFSYSAKRRVNEGDPLFLDGGLPSQSLVSYDITSSYGYAASTFHTPCGFGVTFDQGARSVGQKRWTSLEFRSVMLIIYAWIHLNKKKLRAWYSNFSAFGLVYLAKYPIDLVGVFEDGSIELVQIDGHFIHGHAGGSCKTIPRYKNDMSREAVEKETLARDAAIHEWIQQTDPKRMTYRVIRDCCTLGFNKAGLDNHFRTIPELFNLVNPYKTINDNGTLDEKNDDITFIAIVKGSVPPEKRMDSPGFGPLVIWNNQDQELAWEGRIILTKDYFIYLKREFDFQIEQIEWAVFYPTCRVLNQVYKHLLEMRQALNPSKASLIKVMLNHSCGFMGLNPGKSEPTKCRLTTRFNWKVGTPAPECLASIHDTYYYVITTLSKKKDHVVACHTPLFMFLAIVEMGKMRLNQMMLFLHRHLKPGFFNIVYINTDSTVLVLATPTLEDAVASPDTEEFKRGWDNDLASGRPGCMKLEFNVPHQTNWKMISSALRNFAVVCDRPEYNRFRMSSLNDLTPEKAFEISHQQLEQQPVVVQQIRRKNKLQNLDTHTVEYTYHQHPSSKKARRDPPTQEIKTIVVPY